MADRNTDVCYRRECAIEVLKTLEELVVSLDRIGSASSGMTKEKSDAALSAFMSEHDIFRKVAAARRLLSEPFPDDVGADGIDELERAMQDVPYWRPENAE